MELINDDCLTALTNIADKSVNLVIADLPYGQTDNTWDIKIDLNQLWQHLKRVGTNNCAYIFFTTTKFGFDLISSNKDWFRYDLVWHKSHSCAGFLLAKKMPMRSHEMIYVFYNKLPTYNIVGNHIKLDVKHTKTYLGGETYGTNKKSDKREPLGNQGYPNLYLNLIILTTAKKDITLHKNQLTC